MAAKKGNTNALKHGLYAKRFTDVERADLGKMPSDDLRPEIAMLRVIINQIFELIKPTTEETELFEKPKTISADDLAKLSNSLTTAVTTLSTTARTHAILNGEYNPLNDALMAALANMSAYEKEE